MTRNHFSTTYSNLCLKVPLNPYSQTPSPSYERRPISTNVNNNGMDHQKSRPTSASSHLNDYASDKLTGGISLGTAGKHDIMQENKSPLESFLDFYESIPDYQEVTHLSDREFTSKLKVLREKQQQYLNDLRERCSKNEAKVAPKDNFERKYKKKDFKTINKLEMAKEWINRSCDSLSSLGRKFERDRTFNIGERHCESKTSSTVESPRKYGPFCKKDESDVRLTETSSSLSTDSAVLKLTRSRSSCGNETERMQSISAPCSRVQDHESSTNSREGMENPKSPSNLITMKNDYHQWQSSSVSAVRRSTNEPSSCGRQISGASELTVPECSSSLAEGHHDGSGFEDFYLPSSPWMLSDSESALGTLRHMAHPHSPNAQVSRSLPGSPVMKHRRNISWRGPSASSSENTKKEKSKYRKRKSNRKSTTKPVPFSFMRHDRPPSRLSQSTPELHRLNMSRSPSPKLFRARPIPRNLFSNYVYQKRQEEEFYRALKRKIRSEGMLRGASLPPSMEFRERLSRVQAEAAVSSSSENSGERHKQHPQPKEQKQQQQQQQQNRRRPRLRKPPNFTKCHEKMRQELDERQRRNITTSPSPYSLRTASLSPRRKASPGSGGGSSLYCEARRCRPYANLNLTASRSNLAAVLRIQSARQRLEEEYNRQRQEQRRRAELRLRARITRLTPAWRAIQYSTEEDLALRAAARREEERRRREQHGRLMRHMLDRVHSIPTLFERQSGASRFTSERTSPTRSPTRSSRRIESALDDLDEDEDAADVRVFRGSSGSGSGSRSGSPPGTRCSEKRLHAADRLDTKLRTFHRHLPHRVEFEDLTPGPGRREEEEEEDGEEVEEDVEEAEDADGDDGGQRERVAKNVSIRGGRTMVRELE